MIKKIRCLSWNKKPPGSAQKFFFWVGILIMHPPFRSRPLPMHPTRGFPLLRPRRSDCSCCPFGSRGLAAAWMMRGRPCSERGWLSYYVLFRRGRNDDGWKDGGRARSDGVTAASPGREGAEMSIANEGRRGVGGMIPMPGFCQRMWSGRALRCVRICGSVRVASCCLCA